MQIGFNQNRVNDDYYNGMNGSNNDGQTGNQVQDSQDGEIGQLLSGAGNEQEQKSTQGLPPGLAKKEKLPPGLAKKEKLPPGLAKRLESEDAGAQATGKGKKSKKNDKKQNKGQNFQQVA